MDYYLLDLVYTEASMTSNWLRFHELCLQGLKMKNLDCRVLKTVK